jgi:GNAT superfamily N-acetyltransferase
MAVTTPADGWSEIKRLWTDPEFRGRGIASSLLGAALAHAAESGAGAARLSGVEMADRGHCSVRTVRFHRHQVMGRPGSTGVHGSCRVSGGDQHLYQQ